MKTQNYILHQIRNYCVVSMNMIQSFSFTSQYYVHLSNLLILIGKIDFKGDFVD